MTMRPVFTIFFAFISILTSGQAPVNDDAPGAIELIVGAPPCTGSFFTNTGATRSANERVPECFGQNWAIPVWFKFVATASVVKVTSDYPSQPNAGTPLGEIALYSAADVNDYSTFTILACDFESGNVNDVSTSTLYASGLTIGQTYYLVCDTYIGTAAKFCVTVENLTTDLLSVTNTCSSGYQPSLIIPSTGPYTGQSSLVDNSGKLVAIIQKTASGTLSGNTFTGQNIYTGPGVRQDPAGNYYIDRNFRFSNASNPTNIKVKLFFLDSEIAELTALDPSITLNTLGITRQTGSICTDDFGIGNGSNSPLTITATGSQNGVSWVEFITPGFSNFMIHKAGIVLPVDIEYFTGTAGKSFNTLNWKINCSNSTARLSLERSNDGTDFFSINTWNESTSSCLTSFTYTDRSPLPYHNFYRLKTIDSDGKIKYSTVVHLRSNANEFDIINISPIPVTSNAVLKLSADSKSALEIHISSVEGKILSKQNIVTTAGINNIILGTNKLVPGYYIVTVKGERSGNKSIPLIKM